MKENDPLWFLGRWAQEEEKEKPSQEPSDDEESSDECL